MIQFCSTSGHKFADNLGDFANQDIEIVKAFLDIAMPTISVNSYHDSILTDKYSDVVHEAEEAFALFVLENYLNVWMYQAEVERQNKAVATTQEGNHSSAGGGVGAEDGQGARLLSDNVDIPEVMYQKKIKKRHDKIHSAGKWTEEGLKRYDTILKAVLERRKNREDFENKLREQYVNDIDTDRKERVDRKRKLEEMMEEKAKQHEEVPLVTDVLKIEYL